ncbi:MAG: 5'/3'-nucleotidase SurE [Dehalococcoidia bacterium]|nr:MAG: 5'/3'-nucleotidase SurE [Dehalococcoidia bacterium]
MKILVTNDDGISARGLWVLAKALSQVGKVIVVAPDKEQSGIGTAVSLHQPIKMHRVPPVVPEVEAYAIAGTPADSVILALTRLADDRLDLVVSGINHGPNVGENVLISGTVGAALQGYLYGFPAIAISVDSLDNPYLDTAAELAALLARRVESKSLPAHFFLNVNLPNVTPDRIKGIEITRLANVSHTDLVKEENESGAGYYRLIRRKIDRPSERGTDVWAIEQNIISITPLHIGLADNSSPHLPTILGAELMRELIKKG